MNIKLNLLKQRYQTSKKKSVTKTESAFNPLDVTAIDEMQELDSVEADISSDVTGSSAGLAAKSDDKNFFGSIAAFVYSFFKKKDEVSDKDNEREYSKEEIVMSKILASNTILDAIKKNKKET